MATGILTPYSSAADDAGVANPASTPSTSPPPPKAERSGAAAPPQQATTTSMNNPLAGASVAPQQAAPMHTNEAINTALMNAFHPIVPDQVNSLLGPAIGRLAAAPPPIAYYQPRPTAPIPLAGRSS